MKLLKNHKSNLDVNFFAPILSVEAPESPAISFSIFGDSGDEEGDEQPGIATASKPKVKRPKRYKVLLHNDDYTTMDFVVWVLKRYFGKSDKEAQQITLKIHKEGVGICGAFTFEVAETKVDQVTKAAKEEGHPLQCTLEEE